MVTLWACVMRGGGGEQGRPNDSYCPRGQSPSSGCMLSLYLGHFRGPWAHLVPSRTSLSCLILMTSSRCAKHYERALSIQEVKLLTHEKETGEWAFQPAFTLAVLTPGAWGACVKHSSSGPDGREHCTHTHKPELALTSLNVNIYYLCTDHNTSDAPCWLYVCLVCVCVCGVCEWVFVCSLVLNVHLLSGDVVGWNFRKSRKK